MLSFHVKFVQTDRPTTVKQYAPDLSIRGHKKLQEGMDRCTDPHEIAEMLKTFAKHNLLAFVQPR